MTVYGVPRAAAQTAAAKIRECVRVARLKTRNMTSGSRLPEHLVLLGQALRKQQQQQQLQLPIRANTRAPASSTAIVPSDPGPTPQTQGNIRQLYGLNSRSLTRHVSEVVSIATSQDSVVEVPPVLGVRNAPTVAVPPRPATAVSALGPAYWDHAAGCMARRLPDGRTERAVMIPGHHGFYDARSGDGSVVETDIPMSARTQQTVVAHVQKRPASNRGAGQESGDDEQATEEASNHDGEAAGVQEECDEPTKRQRNGEPGNIPRTFRRPDGVLRMVLATAKSYITFQPSGEPKPFLLCNIGESMKAEHASIIKNIHHCLAMETGTPSKERALALRVQRLQEQGA